MTTDFENLLKRIAAILEKLKISYFVTGGYAVSVWGRLRATFDIDVVINLFNSKDAAVLAKELRKLGRTIYIDKEMMDDAIKNRGEFNVIHAESGIKIDFWAAEIVCEQSGRWHGLKQKILADKKFFLFPLKI